MRLSVVIPSRSRRTNLEQVVLALENQTLDKSEYEIIVSDDNSDDSSSIVFDGFRHFKNFKYIGNSVPKLHSWNASVPRNLGALIADSSTTHLLFVDSDVVLPENALRDYLSDIDQDPNRVIIGPYDFYRDGNETIQVPDVRNKKFEEVEVSETFETIHDGLACFGGNIVIPKDIFWSVGGFDEDVHIGLEDGSMGIKLWKKQTKFSYDRRTRGKHLWHETPPDRFPPDMANHVEALNQKHFHMSTKEVETNMDLITATRETYAEWGFPNWNPPESWQKGRLEFMMKVKK